MALKFNNIVVKYEDKEVIKNLSLHVKSKKLTIIAGLSGAGKTTLLKSINGLVNVSSGTIDVCSLEKKLNPKDRKTFFGYVIQNSSLFSHLTIRENLTLARKYRLKKIIKNLKLKKSKKEIIYKERKEGIFSKDVFFKRLEVFFNDFSLPLNLLDILPKNLSGGQQQRISIIRSLLLDNDVILMDEPFSSLDPIVKKSLQNHTYHLIKKYNKTIIMVSHDPYEMLSLADEIVLLKDGKLYGDKTWTPAEIKKSKDNWIRKFFLFDVVENLRESERTS